MSATRSWIVAGNPVAILFMITLPPLEILEGGRKKGLEVLMSSNPLNCLVAGARFELATFGL
jgi:hypothetical protein